LTRIRSIGIDYPHISQTFVLPHIDDLRAIRGELWIDLRTRLGQDFVRVRVKRLKAPEVGFWTAMRWVAAVETGSGPAQPALTRPDRGPNAASPEQPPDRTIGIDYLDAPPARRRYQLAITRPRRRFAPQSDRDRPPEAVIPPPLPHPNSHIASAAIKATTSATPTFECPLPMRRIAIGAVAQTWDKVSGGISSCERPKGRYSHGNDQPQRPKHPSRSRSRQARR
jgi:hypothetical protein